MLSDKQDQIKGLIENRSDSILKEISELKESIKEATCPEKVKKLEMQLAEKRARARKMAQEMKNMQKRHEEEKARLRAEKSQTEAENLKLKAENLRLTAKKAPRPALADAPTNEGPIPWKN